MTWWRGLAGAIEADVPLADKTWFRLGGAARWLASPQSPADLAAIVRRAADEGLRWRALGAGANVLIRDDGFDGVVLRLDGAAFCSVQGDGERLEVGGGCDMPELTRTCARQGLAGIEGLAGIPGTLGGFVRMNAGGRYGSIGDVVKDVTLVNERGVTERLSQAELGFGYRSSAVGSRLVVSATLKLQRVHDGSVLDRFRAIFAEKTRSQPLSSRSAGCVFKNPPGDSAGRLIDQAGLKGLARGGASVSERHANFIVTREGARSGDVLSLIDEVRTRVRAEAGIELQLEIDVW